MLWISYFVVLALDKGIGWPPTLWVGALMVGVMTGFGVAFLVAPPSYGRGWSRPPTARVLVEERRYVVDGLVDVAVALVAPG